MANVPNTLPPDTIGIDQQARNPASSAMLVISDQRAHDGSVAMSETYIG